ncbi:MAG: hypothetical protein ACE5LB_17000 [Acidiferrobacterales bacterium]
MKATVSPISQRIALNLDVAITFEALILNKLMGIPAARQKEWLRGLLVQGFKNECRAIRDVQFAGETDGDKPGTQNLAPAHTLSAASDQNPPPRQKASPQTALTAVKTEQLKNTVSFAALRKVIG